ncbi:hypothetical protein Tco_0315172, partial [Tanacetum coccineum]
SPKGILGLHIVLAVFVMCVESPQAILAIGLAFVFIVTSHTISPLGVLRVECFELERDIGVLGRWEWVGVSCGEYLGGGLGSKLWGKGR